jgi:bifunctional non-homologous end joining protein LigD
VFWPDQGYTKGDLLRYYTAVSPALLPNLADRPLVMKRLPNGIRGKAFYQQRAPEDAPAGVRVETLPDDSEVPSRVIGGSLKLLLYMTQLGAVSQDPWFSRVDSRLCPDHVALDLDPMPGIRFTEVLDVARWAHDELQALGVEGYPKTSGADGLHIYVPLPPDTPYDTAVVFCQLLATLVAQKHPKLATVTRSVHARGRKVYVDYLQNVRGKTLATAYSARASEYAGVSAPLRWEEVHAGIEREDFNLRSMPDRIHEVGDLWAGLRRSRGVNLRGLVEKGARPKP